MPTGAGPEAEPHQLSVASTGLLVEVPITPATPLPKIELCWMLVPGTVNAVRRVVRDGGVGNGQRAVHVFDAGRLGSVGAGAGVQDRNVIEIDAAVSTIGDDHTDPIAGTGDSLVAVTFRVAAGGVVMDRGKGNRCLGGADGSRVP